MSRAPIVSTVSQSGNVYEIKTEDLSPQAGIIQTLIFYEKNLIGTKQRSYEGILPSADPFQIVAWMQEQHRDTLQKAQQGFFNDIVTSLNLAIPAYQAKEYTVALEHFHHILAKDPHHKIASGYVKMIQKALQEHPSERIKLSEEVSKEATLLFQNNQMEASKQKLDILKYLEVKPQTEKQPYIKTEISIYDPFKMILVIGFISFIFLVGVTVLVIMGYVSDETKLREISMRGNRAFKGRQLHQAINEYALALNMNPPVDLRIRLLHNLGEAYRLIGSPIETFKNWELALLLDPTDNELRFKLASLYFEEKEYKKTIGLLKDLRGKAAFTPEVQLRLGLAYLRDNQLAAAVALLEGELSNRSRDVSLALAEAYYKLGVYEKAELSYLHTLELSPGDYTVLMKLTQFYLLRGQIANALEQLEKTMGINMDEGMYTIIGRQHLQSGDPIQAVHVLEKAVKTDPLSENAYIYLGITYIELGLYDHAKTLWQEAEQLNPSMKPTLEYLKALIPE